MNTRNEKAFRAILAVIDCSKKIEDQLKKVPSNKKKSFKLKVNRRPMKRGKTNTAFANITLDTILASIRISNILSQPIPKFKKGNI